MMAKQYTSSSTTQVLINANDTEVEFMFNHGANISANNGTALVVEKQNATVGVNSEVTGSFGAVSYGIDILGYQNVIDSVVINVRDSGVVLGNRGIHFGDGLDNFTLVNNGHIAGDEGGVEASAKSGNIDNSGTIDGIIASTASLTITNNAVGVINRGILLSGLAVANMNRQIFNNGIINADTSGVAIHGSVGNDLIENSGAIIGNVYLEDGDDVFKQIGTDATTRILGTVDGGNGNDTYEISREPIKISEANGGGYDTLILSAMDSYTLADTQFIEKITGDLKTLRGNSLSNFLVGGDSANTFYGMDGDDFIQTGNGNDYLDGGKGKDSLGGGFGNDVYIVDNAADFIRENDANSNGRDTVRSSASAFTLTTGVEDIVLMGASNISATGNISANKMIGNSGNNNLNGGSGADQLFGNSGKDVLKGGSSKDRIEGGTGLDRLYGGTGADTFVFHLKDTGKSRAGADVIYDFATGDHIDLHLIDANTRIGGNQSFKFIGTAGFHHKAGELRFDRLASDTYIYGDVNGDGRADFAIHLDDAKTMSRGHFIL